MSVKTHATHCCVKHGCKYGRSNCPVKLKEVEQEFPCEACYEDEADKISFLPRYLISWYHHLR